MRKIASIVILIVWLGLIFGFSSDVGEVSSGMSSKVITVVVKTLTNIEENSEEMEEIINKYSFPVRKLAHFVEYFILGVITLNLFVSFNINRRVLIYTTTLCILAASLDEFHQTFVPGRSGNINDVLLDSSGALIGAYLVSRFYLFKEYYKKQS